MGPLRRGTGDAHGQRRHDHRPPRLSHHRGEPFRAAHDGPVDDPDLPPRGLRIDHPGRPDQRPPRPRTSVQPGVRGLHRRVGAVRIGPDRHEPSGVPGGPGGRRRLHGGDGDGDPGRSLPSVGPGPRLRLHHDGMERGRDPRDRARWGPDDLLRLAVHLLHQRSHRPRRGGDRVPGPGGRAPDQSPPGSGRHAAARDAPRAPGLRHDGFRLLRSVGGEPGPRGAGGRAGGAVRLVGTEDSATDARAGAVPVAPPLPVPPRLVPPEPRLPLRGLRPDHVPPGDPRPLAARCRAPPDPRLHPLLGARAPRGTVGRPVRGGPVRHPRHRVHAGGRPAVRPAPGGHLLRPHRPHLPRHRHRRGALLALEQQGGDARRSARALRRGLGSPADAHELRDDRKLRARDHGGLAGGAARGRLRGLHGHRGAHRFRLGGLPCGGAVGLLRHGARPPRGRGALGEPPPRVGSPGPGVAFGRRPPPPARPARAGTRPRAPDRRRGGPRVVGTDRRRADVAAAGAAVPIPGVAPPDRTTAAGAAPGGSTGRITEDRRGRPAVGRRGRAAGAAALREGSLRTPRSARGAPRAGVPRRRTAPPAAPRSPPPRR